MFKSIFVFAFLFLLGCSSYSKSNRPKVQTPKWEPLTIFQEFWKTAEDNVYPIKLKDVFFTSEQYAKLQVEVEKTTNLKELAFLFNQFLDQLKVSHTHFYTKEDLDFYFFRSLFTTRVLDQPTIWHIGSEYQRTTDGFIVRSVLDGFPAKKIGLRRGDIILQANDLPFDPISSLQNNSEVNLLIRRNSEMLSLNVRPVFGGLQRAYVEAIKSSVRRFTAGKKMIGYVHLWTGTHEESSIELQKAVRSLRDCDAIILDLRNGYGGAWWDHLDPFYKDSSSYFKATWIERNGKKSDMFSERKKNKDSFKGPMAVLINEGVRSGKEALAFQFKKTKRAVLIGTKTAGFFVAGGAYFREIELPYFLYLSSKGLLLDGINLEGHGVEPDLLVPFPVDQSLEIDPQLEKAKEVLKRKIKR